MCLSELESKKFEYKKENDHFVGYKYFYNRDYSHLHFPFKGKSSRIPLNTWIDEKNWRIFKDETHIEDSGNLYKTGFHIYTEKPLLKHRKVYFRGVVAQGYQQEDKVIVAKEMYIPKLRG